MKDFKYYVIVTTLCGASLVTPAHAVNIIAADDISMDVPIADKSPEEKAIILDRRAYYFLKGDSTARRLKLLESNANQLLLRLDASVKPGAYELFVQAPGHKKLAINHNLQVHSPAIISSQADALQPGARVYLSGFYFGHNPKLAIDYRVGDRPAIRTKAFLPDKNSFKFDDPWDKYATLYPTDTINGESYLEAIIPQLPRNSHIVAIRLTTNTGEETSFADAFEVRSATAQASASISTPHQRGELISWSFRDSEIRNTHAWDYMLNGLTDQGGWWSKTAANSLLITTKLWREMKYSLRLFNVSYYTEDAKGRIVPTAGVLIIPILPAGSKTPLVSFQHGTMLMEKEAPTVSNGPELGMAVVMASASGLPMTVPDHLGLGIEAFKNPQEYHPYCQWAPLGRDNGDMLVAVSQLIKEPTFERAVQDRPRYDGRLFLTGYSEGGYLTLGLHRELETHPEQYPGLKVTASAPLSGPYALSTTMLSKLMERQKFSSPYFAPYLLVTLNQTYETFPSADQYFAMPYDQTVAPLIDGLHSDAEVNKSMPTYIEDMILPSIRNELKSGTGELFNTILANDLTGADGSGYSLDAPIHFIHGADDDLVPRGNTDRVTDYFRKTQLKTNVDSVYLNSNVVMWAAHLAGQSYHVLYAPLALGESLEWLDKKIKETQTMAR